MIERTDAKKKKSPALRTTKTVERRRVVEDFWGGKKGGCHLQGAIATKTLKKKGPFFLRGGMSLGKF